MKHLIIVFLLCSLIFGAEAQTYKQSDRLLNLGIGLGTGRNNYTPLLIGSYEVGVHEYISVGGYVNFIAGGYEYTRNNGWSYNNNPNNPWVNHSFTVKETWSNFGFGGRASFHFSPLLDLADFDLYAGLGIGTQYRVWRQRVTNNDGPWSSGYDNKSSGLDGFWPGLFIGGKWFFQDNMGLWTELGVVNGGWWQFGLALKL